MADQSLPGASLPLIVPVGYNEAVNSEFELAFSEVIDEQIRNQHEAQHSEDENPANLAQEGNTDAQSENSENTASTTLQQAVVFSSPEEAKTILMDYPVVYVISEREQINIPDKKKVKFIRKYNAYVGETNNIAQRTRQHFYGDPAKRDDFFELKEASLDKNNQVTQYVIGHPHFNKSLTLDVENKLINYMLSSPSVHKVYNRRGNEQGNYYTKKEFDDIFHSIWLELHNEDSDLFPVEEIILDSALFKASPFHQLNEIQQNTEEYLLRLIDNKLKQHSRAEKKNADVPADLIFVQGAAGTGKTVLLSHLFNRLIEDYHFNQDVSEDSNKQEKTCYLLIRHDQQERVYSQIARKLSWEPEKAKDKDKVVMQPSTFIHTFSKKRKTEKGGTAFSVSEVTGSADVVVIDEAHLLATQNTQANTGENMIFEVARRAKVVVAVFDPKQILQSDQRWDSDILEKLGFNIPAEEEHTKDGVRLAQTEATIEDLKLKVTHIYLDKQMRMAADPSTLRWIDNLADGKLQHNIPLATAVKDDRGKEQEPYEIRVFSSPNELFEAIRKRSEVRADGAEGKGLSRVVATYDWPYKASSTNPDDVSGLWNVYMKRNAQGQWEMSSGHDLNLSEEEYAHYVHDDVSKEDIFCHPWNYEYGKHFPLVDKQEKDDAWAEAVYSQYEVGSTFSIQGFDLNYAGVIIGPSFTYDEERHEVVIDSSHSQSTKATQKREQKYDYSVENLRSELNVLLKRGVHGLYLFAVDPKLQEALQRAAEGELA